MAVGVAEKPPAKSGPVKRRDGPLKPGDTVFIVGTLVEAVARDGELAASATVDVPVRWSEWGFRRVTVPIAAIARP